MANPVGAGGYGSRDPLGPRRPAQVRHLYDLVIFTAVRANRERRVQDVERPMERTKR